MVVPVVTVTSPTGKKAEHDIEEAQGVPVDGFSVPNDCYGDMIMTLVLSGQGCRAHTCGRRCLWTATSLGIFMLNNVLQLGLSYILYATAVEHSEDKYERLLGERISYIDEALQINRPMGNSTLGQQTVDMCSNELASVRGWHAIYYLVVFLWYSRMIQELSESIWICAVVWQIPSTSQVPVDGADEEATEELIQGKGSGLRSLSMEVLTGDTNVDHKRVPRRHTNPTLLRSPTSSPGKSLHSLPRSMTEAMEEQKGSMQVVTRVTPLLRWAILFLVGSWKFALACWISWVGAKFLTLSPSTTCLVIKALSLQYVIQIDELLFRSFASLRRQDEVARSRLIYQQPELAWWSIWASSLVRFLAALSMTVLTLDVVFGQITSFRLHCCDYMKRFPQPYTFGEQLTNFGM